MAAFGRMGKWDPKAVLAALDRSLAIIEFDPSGAIVSANENFCRAMGYAPSEIVGQHHRILVDPTYSQGSEYAAFWGRIARGEFDAAQYLRIGKHGNEVWIQATYNPVRNKKGAVTKIIKVASIITGEKRQAIEMQGKVDAISRSQAVIEFTPGGKIITANRNFLKTMGYSLSEVEGRHHSMFLDAAEAKSDDYSAFWRRLNDGEFIAAEFKRIAKDGHEVWIQASYNPVFDDKGRVNKVVKFATDVTGRVRAVDQVAAGLAQLAKNNLGHRLEGHVDPAFEKVRDDFNVAIGLLDAAMAAVASSTTSVGGGAEEIASASLDLSRRTELQAASLEETAAALDEITATVKRSADGAKQASAAASSARSDALKSGMVVNDAVSAMREIEQSSKEITQIIGVIDEIAFQTNLLALNAGVEAARAGDGGRGFAVVASEVRALAQRSAHAAREINTLIATSSAHVERGVKLVGDTGDSLANIVGKVTEIDALISEIALSSQEQATALNQVNSAVNQMDLVTQQNAAMVEQATAAASSLKVEARELSRLVEQFQGGSLAHLSMRGNIGHANRDAHGLRVVA